MPSFYVASHAMPGRVRLLPSNHEFQLNGSDTVLEAALRAGLAMNYGCSNGACGLCQARAVSGKVDKVRRHDYVFGEAEKLQGCFLLCSYTASSDLVIEATEASGTADIPLQQIVARVKRVEHLSDQMRVLHVQTPRTQRLRFLAGQFAQLELDGTSAVQLPIASCPCDDRNLQFQVRAETGNSFNEKVFESLAPNESIAIEGPQGNFILKEPVTRPLVLIAWDTGFAAIKSVLEHAQAIEVETPIRLYWIASTPDGHYMSNLVRSWRDAFDNFHYELIAPPSEAKAESDPGGLLALDKIIEDRKDLARAEYYLAGPESMTGAAEQLLKERGIQPRRIVRQQKPAR